MPSSALPPARTEAARAARMSFHCDLCNKGYARLPEWEAHEASYDHQHTKRLKEMKQMQKDPAAAQRARKAERRADESGGMIRIKPLKLGGGSGGAGGGAGAAASSATQAGTTGAAKPGFKKGGFKSAFGEPARVKVEAQAEDADGALGASAGPAEARELDGAHAGHTPGHNLESDDDGDDDRYDPARPTGCMDSCAARLVRV